MRQAAASTPSWSRELDGLRAGGICHAASPNCCSRRWSFVIAIQPRNLLDGLPNRALTAHAVLVRAGRRAPGARAIELIRVLAEGDAVEHVQAARVVQEGSVHGPIARRDHLRIRRSRWCRSPVLAEQRT